MSAALGMPTAAAPNPITDHTGEHAGAATDIPAGLLPDPAVATPHGDDDLTMEDGGGEAAAPPSASVRLGPSPPVDDDTGPQPGQGDSDAAPVDGIICHWDEDRDGTPGASSDESAGDGVPSANTHAPAGGAGEGAAMEQDGEFAAAASEQSGNEDDDSDVDPTVVRLGFLACQPLPSRMVPPLPRLAHPIRE